MCLVCTPLEFSHWTVCLLDYYWSPGYVLCTTLEQHVQKAMWAASMLLWRTESPPAHSRRVEGGLAGLWQIEWNILHSWSERSQLTRICRGKKWFLLLFLFYFLRMGLLLACVSVHHIHPVLSEARRGYQIPWGWSYRQLSTAMCTGYWIWTSGRAASAVNHRAIYLAPRRNCFTHKLQMKWSGQLRTGSLGFLPPSCPLPAKPEDWGSSLTPLLP